jgi:preprotein translocase subunit SecA
LRGRAGRQGDPGSSRFFLSLEDDLMRIFGSDRISGLMQRLGMEEGVPIEHGMVTRAIERAQKQVEAQNFAVRKHLLEYDDVMNKQRESVYTLRREILEGQIHLSEEEVADIRGYVLATAEEMFDDRIEQYIGKDIEDDEWDLPAMQRELTQLFALDEDDFRGIDEMGSVEMRDELWKRILAKYEEKEKIVPRDILTRVERDIMLQIVDQQWKDHLYSLDHLKEGIGLRGYGQRDPLVEYKKESFGLFQDMRGRIEEEVVRYLWWLKPVVEREGGEAKVAAPVRPQPRKPAALNYNNPQQQQQQSVFAPKPAAPAAPAGVQDLVEERQPARVGGDDVVKTVKREEPKIGRNDPCWCGSGKKYKKCHGA